MEEVVLPLTGGRHTKIVIIETPNGRVGFPVENLNMAKEEGTAETKKIIKEMNLSS